MLSEINHNNLFAHVAGLTEQSKQDFIKILNKSSIINIIEIVDIDLLTNKIIEDTNMEILFTKYEYYFSRIKDKNLSQIENKLSLQKSKIVEKNMFQYWKAKLEYNIKNITKKSKKKILLIGYISFFKNHKININLDINTKFFVKVDYINHSKSIIKYNLEHSKEDIINGDFDLNYLDSDFLTKKRILLQNTYSKINYIVININSIINILELYHQIDIPNVLYFASFIKYDKKIPILSDIIITYSEEWLALSSILYSQNDNSNNIEKGIDKSGKLYLKLSQEQIKKYDCVGYLYEITNTNDFLPFPTKNNVYKYFYNKSIKINRVLTIKNILNQIKDFNINIVVY